MVKVSVNMVFESSVEDIASLTSMDNFGGMLDSYIQKAVQQEIAKQSVVKEEADEPKAEGSEYRSLTTIMRTHTSMHCVVLDYILSNYYWFSNEYAIGNMDADDFFKSKESEELYKVINFAKNLYSSIPPRDALTECVNDIDIELGASKCGIVSSHLLIAKLTKLHALLSDHEGW